MFELSARAMSSVDLVHSSADKYLQNSVYQAQDGKQLLTKVEVSPGSLVLDLGCGTGHLATVLSEMVGPEGKVVAVDPDAERIKIAKEKNARPNIDYVVADDQSFPGDRYALIVSSHSVHWIEDKEAMFARLHDKLAVGGTFAFVAAETSPIYPPITKKAFRDLISPNFEEMLLEKTYHKSANEYESLAKSARFDVKIVNTVVNRDVRWQSVEGFLEYWAGVSHGYFEVTSVDQKALENFKENHKTQLISELVIRNVLYMVLVKA